jgi:CBS domain-containing protein
MESQIYLDILKFREQQLDGVSMDHIKLNILHEDTLQQVLHVAINNTKELHGPPPSSFSFFVMGSAGRREQSVYSDQDHGIVYEVQSELTKNYFLKLGTEITKGLHMAGFEYCDGNVMASNPLWCKSLPEWKQQLGGWTNEASWETIRNLLIFIDSRSVYGDKSYIALLKEYVFQVIHREHLLKKVLSNTMHHKKGISVLGQILTETHGSNSGSLNIKETAILPFVNAARLIAVKVNSLDSSTLARLEYLPDSLLASSSKKQFLKIINYRLWFGNNKNYQAGHYIPIDRLTKEQKKELKEAMNQGEVLFHFVKRFIEKDDKFG